MGRSGGCAEVLIKGRDMRFFKETVILFIKGGVIGLANIIPGLSGGTLAVVLGIYDKLIETIAHFFRKKEKRWEYIGFLSRIFAGAAFSIFFLANIMDFLLEYHFNQTMFLFMGLILGGVPPVIRAHEDMRIRTSRILSFVLGLIVILGLSMLGRECVHPGISALSVNMVDNRTCLMILIAGFFAGGAMIIPGISGSFILVLLGQYAVIIAAVKTLTIKPLIFMAVGAAAGILVFSKIIETCLEKIPSLTYYFVLGLILASFYKIFPGMPVNKLAALYSISAFACGIGISYLLSKMSPIPKTPTS